MVELCKIRVNCQVVLFPLYCPLTKVHTPSFVCRHDVYDETFARAILTLLDVVKAKFRRAVIVWRDISPTHPAGSNLTVGHELHGWSRFSRWNVIARKLFLDAGHHVLQIEEPSLLRAGDAHIGCRKSHTGGHDVCDELHWCNPSVSSVPHMWLQLLYNLLVTDRKAMRTLQRYKS